MSEVYSKTTTSKNPQVMYNGGLRSGAIRYIVIHHNATTNKDAAMNTWVQGTGSYTSAHYEITDNEIIGCLGENYVAYHSGGTGGSDVPKIANINQLSIGLEHVNSSGAPTWGVSDKTLRQSAKLVADICKRYKLPIDRTTIKTHGEITATACPSGLDTNKLIKYAKEAAGTDMKRFKEGDKIRLTAQASQSVYGTPFSDAARGTWGIVTRETAKKQSKSEYFYQVVMHYKDNMTIWNVLQQDLQDK